MVVNGSSKDDEGGRVGPRVSSSIAQFHAVIYKFLAKSKNDSPDARAEAERSRIIGDTNAAEFFPAGCVSPPVYGVSFRVFLDRASWHGVRTSFFQRDSMARNLEKKPEYRGDQLHMLTVRQARLLDAVAARIFPTTETPGAVEAGAVFYLDRALDKAYPELLPVYARALRALDKHSRKQFRDAFLKLSGDQQDAVLRDFEAGRVDDFAKAGEFFETARNHILEGVFGEPKYGGNRDMIGWRLVGFPGQQYGYPDPYINKVVDLEPVACDGPPKKPGES